MSTTPDALSEQGRAVLQLVRTQIQIARIRHEHHSHPGARERIAADIRFLTERYSALERMLRFHTVTPSAPSSRLARLSDCIATIAGSVDPRSIDALEHVLASQLADRIRTLQFLAVTVGDRRLQQWTRGLHTVGAA